MLRFWRGSTFSGWDPIRYRMNTPAIIVGAQALHATGYAMGIHFDGSDNASITYFGDGATSQGDISEAMGFAASFAAPVVFFCQNNQWAISEPVHLQTRTAAVAPRSRLRRPRRAGRRQRRAGRPGRHPRRPRTSAGAVTGPPSSRP